MTTLAIDTLATMRKLEKAGFDTEQAEAVAEAVAEVVGATGGRSGDKGRSGSRRKIIAS